MFPVLTWRIPKAAFGIVGTLREHGHATTLQGFDADLLHLQR